MTLILTDAKICELSHTFITGISTHATNDWIQKRHQFEINLHSLLQYRNTFIFQQLFQDLVHLDNNEFTRRRLRSLFNTKMNRSIATSMYMQDTRLSMHTLFQYLCWPKYDKYFSSKQELDDFRLTFNIAQLHRWLYRDYNDNEWNELIEKYKTFSVFASTKTLWETIDYKTISTTTLQELDLN